MYNSGATYEEIISKFNVIPSHISNVVTGEKFKELFFYLYPNGINPNLRRKQVKHIILSKEEDEFLKKEIKKRKLFADIRSNFTKKFKPISRGQFDRYAKKNGYKTPYFVNLSDKQLKRINNLKKQGLNFNEITEELNKDGIKITRPTVQKKLINEITKDNKL